MAQTLEHLRARLFSKQMSDLLSPSSVATAILLLVVSWYFVYLFNTFVLTNLKAIPASPAELAIPYYNAYIQSRGKMNHRSIAAHNKFGSIVRVAPDRISIADPDAIQDLLKATDLPKHPPTYKGITHIKSRPGIAQTLDRTEHKRLRRVISPAFSVKYLMNLEPLYLQVYSGFERSVLSAPKGEDGFVTVDMYKKMHHIATDVISITAFGDNFRLVENGQHPFPSSVQAAFRLYAFRVVLPFGLDIFDRLFYNKINDYQKNFVMGSIRRREQANRNGEQYNDILQWIVNQGKNGSFDDIDMAAMCRTMLTAGSDTTGNTMSWAIGMLLCNPRTLEKLRKELDDAFPEATGAASMPLQKLKNLPYLNAVLYETLRLRPAAGHVWREFDRDTEISVRDEDGNPKAYLIPAGTMVYIPIGAVHVSPKVWLRANEFYPERWLESGEIKEEEIFQYTEDNASNTKPASKMTFGSKDGYWGKPVLCNKNAFLPFSLGSRDCVGQNFAWNEMRIIIAYMIRRFDLVAAFDTSVEIPSVNYLSIQIARPDGLPVKLKPRK